MGSNFSTGRVSRGVSVVFDGDLWVEEPSARGRQVPWKAGFFSPQVMAVITGDCRLELKDGRSGTMSCTKSQPGMSGGSNVQFQGIGPLSAPGDKTPEEVLPERVDLRLTRIELEHYERAAEGENLSLTAWIRDRLRKAAEQQRGA